MPGEAPISAATLPFNALFRSGLDSQSLVFFSTPGTPWFVFGSGDQQSICLPNGVAKLHDARRDTSRFDIAVVQWDSVNP